MLPDLLDSLARPGAYRRFAGEKNARTAAYVAFLSLVFVGALGIEIKLRLAPLFTETFAWLETSMPPLQFSSGGVTSALTGPVRLEHPRVKEVAVTIDTGRKDPVTAQQMANAKVMAYLTGAALYVDRGQGQLETIDLTKSSMQRPVTVDASTYKEMERTFDWVFYPTLLLLFFLAFALSLAFSALVYAAVGMVLASLAGSTLGFAPSFRIGVHAQTAGTLVYALTALLPFGIPYFWAASVSLSLAFLWLGTRAAAVAAGSPPAA
jgi:hypothetical protein